MNEEAINEIVKEHYGFTIDEIDENVGNLSLRVNQLQYNNKKFQQEIQQLKDKIDKTNQKLELLLNDLKINSKEEKETGKSYFNTNLFAIRIKEISKTLNGESNEQ